MSERDDATTPAGDTGHAPEGALPSDATTDLSPSGSTTASGGDGWSWRRPWTGWSTPGQWSGTRTVVAMVAALVVGALGALGATAAVAQGDGDHGGLGRGGQFPGNGQGRLLGGGQGQVPRGGQGGLPSDPRGFGDRDGDDGYRDRDGDRDRAPGDRGVVPGQDAPGSDDPSDANGATSTALRI